MLQMRVYSERTSAINGIITNVGEDAHPFVNNAGMFVADGMGGSAGVPVLRLMRDASMKILCPKCFVITLVLILLRIKKNFASILKKTFQASQIL